jgi:hypothetical protein
MSVDTFDSRLVVPVRSCSIYGSQAGAADMFAYVVDASIPEFLGDPVVRLMFDVAELGVAVKVDVEVVLPLLDGFLRTQDTIQGGVRRHALSRVSR